MCILLEVKSVGIFGYSHGVEGKYRLVSCLPYSSKFSSVKIFVNLSRKRCEPYKLFNFCVLIFSSDENDENFNR